MLWFTAIHYAIRISLGLWLLWPIFLRLSHHTDAMQTFTLLSQHDTTWRITSLAMLGFFLGPWIRLALGHALHFHESFIESLRTCALRYPSALGLQACALVGHVGMGALGLGLGWIVHRMTYELADPRIHDISLGLIALIALLGCFFVSLWHESSQAAVIVHQCPWLRSLRLGTRLLMTQPTYSRLYALWSAAGWLCWASALSLGLFTMAWPVLMLIAQQLCMLGHSFCRMGRLQTALKRL